MLKLTVKTLYYSAFTFAIIGMVMEAWDISHNIPFTYWLTGALALVTLLKLPYSLYHKNLLSIVELVISLIAYIYLSYISAVKHKELKLGSITMNLHS